jgi:hypothetical protein
VLVLSLTATVSVLTAPPAAADIVSWTCDDGGGGIVGYTPTSHCAAYTGYITGYPFFAGVVHSDVPDGPIDNLTVSCGFFCGPPPPYTAPPQPTPEERCAYGSGVATDAVCGPAVPVDSPENSQLLQDARNGRLLAGSGAALGSADNPLPLPAGYRPPPSAPHVWGDVAASDAGFSTMVACVVGGGVGSLSTLVLNTIQGVDTNLADLFKAASAGCAAAAAGNTVELAIYKERTRIWYPLDSAGNASRDPSQWYKCIDFKAREYVLNQSGTGAPLHFRYPADYPELAGQTHDFARNCIPFVPR